MLKFTTGIAYLQLLSNEKMSSKFSDNNVIIINHRIER